ncbi:MAG TPA: amino acid adenylation domain-containing protein [Candidatus Angelobacter sp.]|jgi:amino acid adenylation domain-containing protein|nr:amino acid adenylation domain-containing protein [Candidatus Angelobacter sp.]
MSPERAALKKDQVEEERELLRLLLQKEGVSSESWEISSAETGERLPLSWAQKRLWFLDRLQPGSDFYNIALACELHGDLNVPALERSLKEIIRRHGVLRTRFVVEDGEPVQKVEDSIEFGLQLLDLSNQEHAENRKKRAQEIVTQESAKPFDLGIAPLLRGMLIRLGEQEYILALTIHHIVVDEWSLGILQQEMAVLYAAYVQGQESPLKEMPLQYADYTLWQVQWLRGEVFVRQMEYWKKQLSGMPEFLELPTDKPRPAIPQHRGSTEWVIIDKEYWEKMKLFSRLEGASVFMTVLAIYQVLLSRYAGQTDFGVGTPITNRRGVRMEGMIGFCVNTLIMRADLRGEPIFREVLKRVRKATLEAFDHQDLSLEKLVEEFSPERHVSGSPLFQVMFTFMEGKAAPLELPGVGMRPIVPEITTSKYDLGLLAVDSEIPKLAFNYDTELFEADTIRQMLHHFGFLLAGAITTPELRIWDLPMLTQDEIRQLLVEWNPTEIQSGQKCVHELFEEQVRKTPNAPAIVFEDIFLTYRDLNRRANQLAHYLRTGGVKPETRVAIGVERGLEMVVGMIAVLKAGGAYLPLDLTYPLERLQFILQDSAPVALLARGDFQSLPRGISKDLHVIDLANEALWGNLRETNLDRNETGIDPECLAYVIYTSGSTGEPKGSEVPHRSIPGFIFGTDYVRFDEETVLLQHSSVSWDAFTLELWPALLTGGQSVLAHKQRVTSDEIRQYVQGKGVNTLWLTAALLNSIVESDVKCLGGVKYLMTGGETASVTHIRRVLQELPGMRVVNGYGPSECTVFSSCYVVPADLPERVISLPIGKPIGDRRMYVLDQWMNVAPIGVVGEGFIGGASAARGYMGRPDMTAERFVPDPYGGQVGGRLYRTGDLVRWRREGTIEFVGRNDLQVKVRGFRIELAEIEARLLEYDGVKEAVVVAQKNEDASKRLVAYYTDKHSAVSTQHSAPDQCGSSEQFGGRTRGSFGAEQLRSYLAQRLPEYMVPAAYVRLEEFPLTPNGKLDRKRLPVPDGNALAVSGYEEPQGEIETTLAAIWREVLEAKKVGRHDDFFALGGHSLLAVGMITRVREALGLEVELGDVFEHPRLVEFASKIAGGKQAQFPPITKADRTQPIPLSYAQQRLWFLAQMQGVSEVYHIPFGVRLEGKLDRRALGLAFDRLIHRHEALRTTFAAKDGEAVQQIATVEDSRFSLLDYDLRDQDLRQQADPEAGLRSIMEEEAHARFDLEAGPLIRGRLVRQAEDQYALLITMHHIISDGWSIAVLLNELSALYGAFVRGEADPLPELAVQYPDYAVWQRNWMQGEVLRQQIEYWKTTLAGVPNLLELPADHARPADQDYGGAWSEVTLDEGLTAGLKQLSSEHGATLYMTLLAGWAALLGRLSGQQDILIGTPVANRRQAELEGLIGFFVNTLVLRADLSGRPEVGELLQRMKSQSLGAQQHQDIPFEQVVEVVQPERSLAHSPLFQVMFAWQNAPRGGLDLVGLNAMGLEMATHRVARFDLTVSLWETGERIAGGVEYATALFEKETIERYMGYWGRILQGMAAGSGQTVDCLELLSEGERNQLVHEWNRTNAVYPQKCVHELFEDQVRRNAEAVAVEFEGQGLTYAELNRRANQLAHYLKRAGVGPEMRVGICMERGLEMVIGLLGILKAGGAYVALDPHYPAERLKFMVEDSSIAVLITQSGLFEQAPGYAKVIYIDQELVATTPECEENIGLPLHAENLAYVIYTSGSTGKPKGVAIRHSSVNVLLQWAREIFPIEELQGVLASTSICFDLSVFEIFAPLSWGGKTIVVRNALSLAEMGQNSGVSLLNTVPSVMAELLRIKGVPDSIRTVNLAGEALSPNTVEQLYKESKAEQVFNLYGPSEDTTYSTYACFKRGAATARAPIGKPISNTQAYVLDREYQPVPAGVIGELCLGGQGVARGYLNRPELTAEKFVPNPFVEHGGERMYRTGDQVKWGQNGNLEFLGRLDHQMKVRGYRIELGEIEAALQAHPEVEACAVIVREDQPAEKRVVAYVVTKGHATATFREFLKERLPDHTIPSAFVEMERLPLTPNGKLDRRALPVPGREWSEKRGYVGPRNGEEEILCGLFAEVLNRDRVGVHDDFFAIGGHSLLATKLVSRVRDTLGVDVALRSVFESPTIAKLAPRLQGSSKARSSIQRHRKGERAPLSYSQRRLWFINQLQGSSTEYNMPEALRLRGRLDVDALRRTVQSIVDRHESLRTQFAEEQGEPVQIITPSVTVEIPMEDLSGLSEAEQQRQVTAFLNNEWCEPFDLAHGPVLRVKLLKLTEEDHVLMRTFHHIVCDGWSLGVFMREFRDLYEAYSQGRENPLPDLPLQFADFALWQMQWASEGLLDDLRFWKEHLVEIPEELEIPRDRERPPLQTFAGDAYAITLPAEKVAVLKQCGRSTLYMTLLAAFAVLMHRYSGQDDIVVGSPIANREDERLEGLIGFFANMLVMRVRIDPNASFRELLDQVREFALEAYRHQDIPFERLVEELSVSRSLNRTPIFQVIFALQNAFSGTQELRGLEIEPLPAEDWRVRFDLEVNAVERNGRLDIVWLYNVDLFDRWRIEQMAAHYERLLTAAVQDLEQRVCNLGTLSASEIQQLKIREAPPAGKVDRRPVRQAPAETIYVAPRTAMEQIVASVWQEVLGIERVGLDVNFFDLGGHSLLAARVRFNLRQKLQKEIALVDFFSYPTVRLLAEKLEHGGRTIDIADIRERASRQRANVLRSRKDAHRQDGEEQASE